MFASPHRGQRFARRQLLVALIIFSVVTTLTPLRQTMWSVVSAQAASTDVVISQVYGGGGNTGATLRNDFIELFNRGTSPVDVSTWSIQYASSTGATWQRTNLTGTIEPGRYYLVQQAAGTSGTTNLPIPDATGTIAMSATTGKVALVTNQTLLTCGATGGDCFPNATIKDFVGYGTANNFEGAGPTATLSNTTAALRASEGCADTDTNNADFSVGAPNPRNTSSPVNPCGGSTPTPTPTVTPTPVPTPTPTPAPCGDTAEAAFRRIYDVQGSGSTSPLPNGTAVVTEGIVTGDFQGASSLDGFFVQDATGDGNTATSDGIFVFIPATNTFSSIDVQVGQRIRVRGMVREFAAGNNTLTEIDTITELTICDSTPVSETERPQPTIIDLPISAPGAGQPATLERYEGMLVRFPEQLTVTNNEDLGRFGELTLSADGRLFVRTNGQGGAAEENARRRLILDDARNGTNRIPIPYLDTAGTPDLTDDTRRVGDTVTDLTGILSFGFSQYRVQPTIAPPFVRANPRPTAPDPGGNLKVASFNVLNYFTTLTGSDARGADNSTEFERQRTKIFAALKAIDADIFGLIEIENDADRDGDDLEAVRNLVEGLNARYTEPDTYAFIDEPYPGTDAIKVALIYKPSRVTPVGDSVNDIDPVHNRPPLAQTFRLNSNNETFTVVVNHFKAKTCGGATGADLDQGDGQSCFNATRVLQAQALLRFINTLQNREGDAGDDDVLIVGDLNAYGEEDPIKVLVAGGLRNQIAARVPPESRYSFIFDGESGYLDHALTTHSLDQQFSGVAEWHINADEPVVIDYNTESKPDDRYSPTPFRSSDHDPVIVGLALSNGAPINNPPVAANDQAATAENTGLTIPVLTNDSDIDGDTLTVANLTQGTNGTVSITPNDNTVAYTPRAGFSGTDTFTYQASDGTMMSNSAVVTVTINAGGAFQFESATYSADEGTKVEIAVTRSGGSDGEAAINYSTAGGTATAAASGDYTEQSGRLKFAPGVLRQTFRVPILADSRDEEAETVNLILSQPTGSGSLGTPATAVLTIIDVRATPTPP